ncbi:hypothetical protein KUL152_12440 [Tenacibaculum sp. KUL152]|nr:hypothetical protein KUL152_12440 [Tenacibaculum sp. KUL152]
MTSNCFIHSLIFGVFSFGFYAAKAIGKTNDALLLPSRLRLDVSNFNAKAHGWVDAC